MSIDGRINVDCLFHDRSGTARFRVLSMRSDTPLTTGAAAFVTGTSGTSASYIEWANYRDASGNLVQLNNPFRIAFAWSGATPRTLNDAGGGDFRLVSKNGDIAVCTLEGNQPVLQLSTRPGGGTGTYTILLWGE